MLKLKKKTSLKVYSRYRNLFKYNKTCKGFVCLRTRHKLPKYKRMSKTYDTKNTEYTYDYKYNHERKHKDSGLNASSDSFSSIYNEKTISEDLLKNNDVIGFDDVEPLQKVDHYDTIDTEYVCVIYHIYDTYDNEYKYVFYIYEIDPCDTTDTEYIYHYDYKYHGDPTYLDDYTYLDDDDQ